MTDWNAIESYSRLADLSRDAHHLSLQAFLAGPVARFLALASDPATSARARARIMEFARASWNQYCAAARSRGVDGGDLDRQARALVVAHFEAGVADGDYMIDVWDGHATHNYTASVPRSERG